jgi:hypothetical protein
MRSIAQRYPLVTYYVLTLILSGLIFALLFAAGLVEGLFFLATFGPGLAAILVTLLIGGGVGVRELLGKLLIWRVGIQWWLVALLFTFSTIAISVLYTWIFNNTGASIWSAVFFHWIYTYVLDTLSAGMAPPPVAYQVLQYVPYIIIAIVVLVIWGPRRLIRS